MPSIISIYYNLSCVHASHMPLHVMHYLLYVGGCTNTYNYRMTPELHDLLQKWLESGTDHQKRHASFRLAQPDAKLQYPSLFQQAKNLAHAVGGVVSAAVHGEPIVATEEEQARRLAICHACAEWYDPEQERCPHGGCGCFLSLKTRIASQHCPLDPPKW